MDGTDPAAHFARLRSAFHLALERSGAERAAALAAACAAEPELRAEVEGLLAHGEDEGFLAVPLVLAPAETPDPSRAPGPGAGSAPEIEAGGDGGEDPELGLVLGSWERYRDAEPIGRGGMAVVYRAFEPRLKRTVALKFPLRAEAARIGRLRREAECQARVEHPHVLPIYEAGEVAGRFYIAMRYVAGPSLAELAGELDPGAAADLMRQVARGVEAAHRAGLVHRDLKPGNVLIERRSGRDHAWVADFGLAAHRDDPRLTLPGLLAGSPCYMAPERLEGDDQLDARSDIYGIGAAFYEALAGVPPHAGRSALDVLLRLRSEEPVPLAIRRPDLPPGIAAIIGRCLERDPARRYPTALELAEDCDRFLAGEAILAPASAPASRPAPAPAAAGRAAELAAAGFERLAVLDARRAALLLEEAAALAPAEARIHLGRALAWAALGHGTIASEAAERARELAAPGSAERAEAEALGCERRGDWAGALARLGDLAAAEPEGGDRRLRLAAVRLQAGDAAGALAEVAAARAIAGAARLAAQLDLIEARAGNAVADLPRAIAAAGRAAAAGQRQGAPHLVALARGEEARARRAAGAFDRALVLTREQETILGASGDPLAASLAALQAGDLLRQMGRIGEARSAVDAAFLALSEIGDRQALAVALGSRGQLEQAGGALERALGCHQEAAALAREVGDRRTEAVALGNLARSWRELGDHERALDASAAALGRYRALGDRRGVATQLHTIGRIALTRGDLSGAEASILESVAEMTRLGSMSDVAAGTQNLGIAALYRGDLALADLRLAEAERLMAAVGHRANLARCTAVRAELALHRLDLSRAADLYREVLAAGEEAGLHILQVMANEGLAEVARLRGEDAAAATSAGRAIDLAGPGGAGSARATLARLHLARGEPAAAGAHAAAAAAAWAETAEAPFQAEAHALEAEAAARRGETAAADRALARARALLVWPGPSISALVVELAALRIGRDGTTWAAGRCQALARLGADAGARGLCLIEIEAEAALAEAEAVQGLVDRAVRTRAAAAARALALGVRAGISGLPDRR